MVVTVYYSSSSGNSAMKGKQRAIIDYLECHKIKFDLIDLGLNTDAADVMTAKMPKERIPEGRTKAPPPQVFNDDCYCGDYEMFDNAREMEMLCTFFKIPPTEEEKARMKLLNYEGASGDLVDKENDQNAENALESDTMSTVENGATGDATMETESKGEEVVDKSAEAEPKVTEVEPESGQAEPESSKAEDGEADSVIEESG